MTARHRPTGAEAAARVTRSRAVHQAVTTAIADDGPEPVLWLVALPLWHRTKPHPVLGIVDVDAVLGLKSHYRSHVEDWARHWLGTRGYAEILSWDEWVADSSPWPAGCPRIWDVPAARHFTHPNGSRIVAWPDDGLEVYGPDGRRKQSVVTLEKLEEGYGAWTETWFDHDGVELTAGRVAAICQAAGVIAR